MIAKKKTHLDKKKPPLDSGGWGEGNSRSISGSSSDAAYKNAYPVNRIPNHVEPIRAPIGSVFLKVHKVVVADPDPGFSDT